MDPMAIMLSRANDKPNFNSKRNVKQTFAVASLEVIAMTGYDQWLSRLRKSYE